MNDRKVGAVVCALMCAVCAGLSSCSDNSGVHAETTPTAAETSAVSSQIMMNDTSPTYTYDTKDRTVTPEAADTADEISSAEPAAEPTVTTTEQALSAPEPETTVYEAPPQTTPPAETYTQTEEAAPAQTSPAPTYTSPVVTLASSQPSDGYDRSFFSGDLFIGDSISTGYSLYGYLDATNVYAKVGLNPSTVLTKKVSTPYGEIGVSDMVSYTKPDRAYVMLGSNGIQWLSVSNMVESTNKLVSLINETSPDTEVVIISVPPVTPAYDSTVADVNVMAKIDEYNRSLAGYCEENSLLFCDIAEELKDASGYFNSNYAEKDGMHFKPAAYKIVLSRIQSDVEQNETALAAETEVPDDVLDIEDDIFEDVIGDDDESETDTEVTAVPDEEDVTGETVTSAPDEVVIPSETSVLPEPEPDVTETSVTTAQTTAVQTTAPSQTASGSVTKTTKATKKPSAKTTVTGKKTTTKPKTTKAETAKTGKTTKVTKSQTTVTTADKADKKAVKSGKKTTDTKKTSSTKTDKSKTNKAKTDSSKTAAKTAKTAKTAAATTEKSDETKLPASSR